MKMHLRRYPPSSGKMSFRVMSMREMQIHRTIHEMQI